MYLPCGNKGRNNSHEIIIRAIINLLLYYSFVNSNPNDYNYTRKIFYTCSTLQQEINLKFAKRKSEMLIWITMHPNYHFYKLSIPERATFSISPTIRQHSSLFEFSQTIISPYGAKTCGLCLHISISKRV